MNYTYTSLDYMDNQKEGRFRLVLNIQPTFQSLIQMDNPIISQALGKIDFA
jgi:hypothetical protein